MREIKKKVPMSVFVKALPFILLFTIANLRAADLAPLLAQSRPANPPSTPPPVESQMEHASSTAGLDPLPSFTAHATIPPAIRFSILPIDLGKPSPETAEAEENPASIGAIRTGDYHLTLAAGSSPSPSLSLQTGEDGETTSEQDIPEGSAKAGIFGIKAVSGSRSSHEIAHHRHKKHALAPIADKPEVPILAKVGRSLKSAFMKAEAAILPHSHKDQ